MIHTLANTSGRPLQKKDGDSTKALPSASTTQAQARVFIASKHPIVRRGLVSLVNGCAGFTVCGEAEAPAETIKAISELRPDLAIIDITSPERIDVVPGTIKAYKKLPMLTFSLTDNFDCAERALREGASGYILQKELPGRLHEAMRGIAAGKCFVPEEFWTAILQKGLSGKSATGVDALTKREFDVFQRIGQGCKTGQIAKDLEVSVKTIEAHQARMKEKLNLPSALKLACFAAQWTTQNTPGNDGGQGM